MPPLALSFALISCFLAAGCESCEFTYGSLQVSGHLTVKGPMPGDLQVRTCTSAKADDCGPDDGVVTGTPLALEYHASVVPEGLFTCGFDHRWVVVTGTGCIPAAFEAITTDDVDALQISMPVVTDLELVCGQTPAPGA